MKKNKENYFIEYLSLSLSLSYFLIHNIFLVLIGISFSLYLININFINNITRSINEQLMITKYSINFRQVNKARKPDSTNIESSEKVSGLAFVDTIEELGFIPSIDKKDNTNAA